MSKRTLNPFYFILLLIAGVLSATNTIRCTHSPSSISKHISILKIFSHKCGKHHLRFETTNKTVRFENKHNRKKTKQINWIKHVRNSRNISSHSLLASTHQIEAHVPSQELFTSEPVIINIGFQKVYLPEIQLPEKIESLGFSRFSALAYS